MEREKKPCLHNVYIWHFRNLESIVLYLAFRSRQHRDLSGIYQQCYERCAMCGCAINWSLLESQYSNNQIYNDILQMILQTSISDVINYIIT